MGIKSKIIKEIQKKPRSLRELKAKLGNDKKVVRALEELTARGRLTQHAGMYAIPDARAAQAEECEIVKVAEKFGFARPVAGGPDLFIPGRALRGALPGDTVLAARSRHPRDADSPEGEVLAVLKEQNRFTGTVVQVDGGRLALAPDVCPACLLPIKKSADGGARAGEKAAVELIERGERHDEHRAGVSMRFGSAEEARHCVKALLYAAGLSRHFPQSVKEEAKRIPAAITEEELAGRRDFRALPVFTIDAAETKDMDDAVSVERTPAGYRLGVHIADVSHYVRPGSALDAEALARGTSVYYADSVIPMLPRALSNGICSLNEGEDRLTFSCLLEMDEDGHATNAAFARSVIRSRVKGVYSEINALWNGGASEAVRARYAAVEPELALMYELYGKLAALRAQRGAMEIESGEAKLTLDEEGRCVDVQRRARGDAERMIEEFMLLANTAAASLARRRGIPFVYRVHEEPKPERIEALKTMLAAAGVELRCAGAVPTAKELAALLNQTRGTGLERMVHTGVLRSMAKAKYEPLPKGHFGLALSDYAHFTSPIRRYPDLAIHRILAELCAGAQADALRGKYEAFAAEASQQSSLCEVRAMQVERDAEACYKAEFMRRFIGDAADNVWEGVISSVTSFGAYVELPNTVEGLVRAAALSEHPLTLTEDCALYDAQTGRSWRIGDSLRVRAAAVNVACGQVDFVPAD